MLTVHFKGTVLPDIFKLQIHVPGIQWKPRVPTDADPEAIFIIDIVDSQIDVTCQIEKFDFDIQGPMVYIRASDLTTAAVDCLSFTKGWGQTVFFHTYVDPHGKESPLTPMNPALAAHCTAFDFTSGTGFHDAISLLTSDVSLLLAMNDLVSALTRNHLAPINCGRVLDGLRKIVAPDLKPGAGWTRLQGIVNVDRTYTEWVSELSTGPRHGDRKHISGAEINEAVKRCWIVMNRFLEYRKRGDTSLPILEFPILHG